MTSMYDRPLLQGPFSIRCPKCGAETQFSTSHNASLPVNTQHDDGSIERDSWEGEVRCSSCGYAGRHDLDWPADARFQVEHKGQVLWAKDRDMMMEIRRFLAAGADRQAFKKSSAYTHHLVRIPAVFLGARDRDAMLKKIDRVLAA